MRHATSSLDPLGISRRRVDLARLVPIPCGAEAFPRGIPVPAGGSAAGRGLRRLDRRFAGFRCSVSPRQGSVATVATWAGLVCLASAVVLVIGSLATGPQQAAQADITPNQPVGVGKGVFPGRVVWAHDAGATTWEGPGHGHWWESSYTRQEAVDRRSPSRPPLSGSPRCPSWAALIRNFNKHTARQHGIQARRRSNQSELVGCIVGGGGVEPVRMNCAPTDYMNTFAR